MDEPTEYKRCPRCQKLYCFISALGRWQCTYHPGTYDNTQVNGRDRGYTCCGKRHRQYIYTTQSLLTSTVELPKVHIPGCTPCDCGTDFTPVSLDQIEKMLPLFEDLGSMKGWVAEQELIHRKKA